MTPDSPVKPDPQWERKTAHGTPSEYNNHGCRCELCRTAMSAYMKGRAQRPIPTGIHWTPIGVVGEFLTDLFPETA